MRKLRFVISLLLIMAAMTSSVFADAEYAPVDPSYPYGSPVHGLFNDQQITVEGAEGSYSINVPEGMQPWNPSVIIMIPDGMEAEEFIATDEGKEWLAVSGDEGIAVAFAEPSEGKEWGTALRDDFEYIRQMYINMRSKSLSVDHAYTLDKSSLGLVGYEEGGSMALLVAADSPTMFSGVAVIDAAPVSSQQLESLGEGYCWPWPADKWNGVEESALKAEDVEIPAWFIANETAVPEDAVAYFVAVNDASLSGSNVYADEVYASDSSISRVWVSDGGKASTITATEIWNSFLSEIKRFLGFPGGRLAYAVEFTEENGFYVHERMIDGFLRRWMTYVPDSYTGEEAVPMVIVMHGSSASMYAIAEESRWFDVADEYGFIVNFCQAYMNGRSVSSGNIPAAYWHDYSTAIDEGGSDDVVYLNYVIDSTEKQFNIDSGRLYVTGHSNGAHMTWRLALDNGTILTAIAPVGGVNGTLKEGLTINYDMLMPAYILMGEYDNGDAYALVDGNSNVRAIRMWNEHNGVDENNVTITEDGEFTQYFFRNGEDVPLVGFMKIGSTPHVYMPEESFDIWENWFSHYERGEDGTLYYDGTAVKSDSYVQNNGWLD